MLQRKQIYLMIFFTAQTVINDQNVEVPDVVNHTFISELDIVILTADEVRSVLKSLPIGKASGLDDISNRVLKELADQIAIPLTLFLISPLQTVKYPKTGKKPTSAPFPKVAIFR